MNDSVDKASRRRAECDLVIPVFNGLTYVIESIKSVLRHSDLTKSCLYLIDDGSDAHTVDYLRAVAAEHRNIVVHTNGDNIGFVKSCNIGIELGTSASVVLLNSDVVVTSGWLDRLLECAASDPRIASVNPVTNHASQIQLPMAPGANFKGMDYVLRQNAGCDYPDIVTGVGFCLLLRRSALEEVGKFDEVFGRGYCEESDLCMRLTTAGWRTVLADNVYIYHRGGGTFTDRDGRYQRNRAIFDSRWKREYERQYNQFRKNDPLAPLRALFTTRQRWEPMPIVWETGRDLRKAWRSGRISDILRVIARGGIRTLGSRRPVGTPESVANVTRPRRLRVTYVLRDIVVAGGVLSVIQLVNELILLGVEARIVATFEDRAIYDWTRLYTAPIIFKSETELLKQFPYTDVAIATLWSTAPLVAEVVSSGKAKQAAYFVQDYEAWFFADKQSTARQRVKETYALINHRIVKSDWLKGMLAQDGYRSHKIRLGMDLARFYPRDVGKHRVTILAMARPGTPRRGFVQTCEALAKVKEVIPEAQVVLFGAKGLKNEYILFDFRDEGVVVDPERLAFLYSEADVFLDGSEFQGFGRCGLEAMACGTACVLTNVGGVTEYVRENENALLVPPSRPDAFADAILKLIRSADLRERLAVEGRRTAHQFCHKREARETLSFLTEIS